MRALIPALVIAVFSSVVTLGLSATALAQTGEVSSASPDVQSTTPSARTSEQIAPPPDRFPPAGWPMPVHDTRPRTFALADVLDFSPAGEGNANWDFEGWRGGDYNRLWFKSEGEQSLTQTERNLDVQLLYGRFIKRFYDFQVGGGVQTVTFQGRNVTRGQAVIGLEGFVPYKFDLETLLFISQKGDVSGRVTYLREYLLTQRLILQPRAETNIAVQRVEEFSVGSGLNNVEFGIRLRYEIRREIGPYVGFSLDKSLFGTADLVRAERRDPTQFRFVFGVRAWR